MGKDKFFARIWKGISNFFKRIFARARAIAERVIPVGIGVVENMKTVMDSPVPALLTMLIPGQVDDILAAKIKNYLPDILIKLKIADECAKKLSNDEVIQCAITHLKKYHPDAQKVYYLSIASMLSASLADGKLSWGEIVMLTQYTYDNHTKKK